MPWRRAGFIALALVPAGWAATPPSPGPRAGHAPAPQADGPFAPIERCIHTRQDEPSSSLLLLPRSEDALLWRLALIDSARNFVQRPEHLGFKRLPPNLC